MQVSSLGHPHPVSQSSRWMRADEVISTGMLPCAVPPPPATDIDLGTAFEFVILTICQCCAALKTEGVKAYTINPAQVDTSMTRCVVSALCHTLLHLAGQSFTVMLNAGYRLPALDAYRSSG